MPAPTADWPALLRLARYLAVQARAVYCFSWQDEGLQSARSWTPISPGVLALGDPRVEGFACVECIP
eukprot:1219179-Alexandrium_andersonii.AAC.1